MKTEVPESLLLVAGRDTYPLRLMEAARVAGVKRIEVVAFRGETLRAVAAEADAVHWLHLGRMSAFLDTLASSGIRHVMLAGQIAPRNLFSLRMDKLALAMYRALTVRNAHTIFGAVVDRIERLGITVLPANTFMERYMPEAGVLGRRAPTERECADIDLGLRLVKGTSEFEIGQTVVLKEGVIVAVEAWEGTNRTIRRAGRVGGAGCVVVKLSKCGHDMRFDIPVVGTRTFREMRRAKVTCLAVEARRTILLEQERLVALADRYGMAFVAVEAGA